MKKFFIMILCILGIVATPNAKLLAQAGTNRVLIPDVNFRAYLTSNFPSAMHGNYMDTTDASVVNADSIYVGSESIFDLTGIQYFDGLTYLYCSNNRLSSLPTLPASLTILWCEANQIASLPALPSTLLNLICSGNQLESLPSLPASLTALKCVNNQLTNLPNLPSSVWYLNFAGNQISNISALPSSLVHLYWSNNPITCLPNIPSGLIYYDRAPVLCGGTANTNNCDQCKTWTGANSTNWHTASNWEGGYIPSSTDKVYIPNTARKPVISQNISIKKLNNSGSITIQSGNTLVCTDSVSGAGSIGGEGTLMLNGTTTQFIADGSFANVTVNNSNGVNIYRPIKISGALILKSGRLTTNGNLTLTSTRTSSAYVDDFSTGNTGTISGNITYSRSLAQGNNQIASMLSGTTFSSIGRCVYTYDFSEPNNTWTQKPLANCASPFTYGTSALFYSFDNATAIKLGGTMNSGNQSFPIIRSSSSNLAGWNVLGNPYLSPISWRALALVSGNTAVSNMAMYALNPATNTNAIVSANGVIVNGGTPTVAVGQGFYLRRTSVGTSGANISFNNSVRVATSSASMIRQASLENSIRLALQTNGKAEEDEIVIYHDFQGTDLNNLSDLDAAKLPSETHYSELSISGAEALAIKALPSNLNEVEIPLAIKTTSDGLHTISVKDINLESNAILWDKMTDNKTVINADSKYLFNSEIGAFSNRFVLILGKNNIQNISSLNVYPNPAKDQFTVEVTNPTTVQVLNALGQLMISQVVNGSTNINTSMLPTGMYTVLAEGYKASSLVVSK